MAEEPSNGELGRRLDVIQGTLNGLVGRPEYEARQEAAERRFIDMAADISALSKRLDSHEQGHAASSLSWRAIIWPMLGAGVASAAAIAVQLIASGGH